VKLSDAFYALATGPERRRQLLTPVGLVFFFGMLAAVIFGSLSTDRALALPRLLPGVVGSSVGVVLLALGLALWGWCVKLFRRARGTPVPVNPPRGLVLVGPYAWVRNPMLTGVFACLFGLGFILHSVSLVFVWTPAFIFLDALELKLVEEPELERRFGAKYSEYRCRVPMFFPRIVRRAE
jgi:protein-S-isoprenylcysteine O-methyltransferase Ste14